jgi:hypothetical protein
VESSSGQAKLAAVLVTMLCSLNTLYNRHKFRPPHVEPDAHVLPCSFARQKSRPGFCLAWSRLCSGSCLLCSRAYLSYASPVCAYETKNSLVRPCRMFLWGGAMMAGMHDQPFFRLKEGHALLQKADKLLSRLSEGEEKHLLTAQVPTPLSRGLLSAFRVFLRIECRACIVFGARAP